MPSATLPKRLCLSLALTTVPEVSAALRAASELGSLVDVVEIRLDALNDRTSLAFAPELLCRQTTIPLLFTNRPSWEGGEATEPDPQRIIPLLLALEHGCAYVDIELRSKPKQLRRVIEAAARDGGLRSRAIVSWHDFTHTPNAVSLRGILAQQLDSGAGIGKIVTMANSAGDVLRVLALLETAAQLDFPLIAFCMGEIGKISRVATSYLGGYLTYATAAEGQATAPGQLPLAWLREIETRLAN